MKVYLMYKDRDFNRDVHLPKNTETIIKDLGLDVILEAMAKEDNLIYDISKIAIFTNLTDVEEIFYRQEIIKDCINNPSVIREIFNIAIEAIIRKRKWSFFNISSMSINSIMFSSVLILQSLLELLTKLREIADENINKFKSEGFKRFFKMIQDELGEDYLLMISKTLKDLKFEQGMLISAQLGNYNQGVKYFLCKPFEGLKNQLKWQFAGKICIHPRDESGGIDLTRRQERATNLATNALAQSADHVTNFFAKLRDEIAFYVGCINLYEKLQELGLKVTFPVPYSYNERKHSFEELYDISLALLKKGKVVSNTLNLDGEQIIFITGANQGGKSTFVRNIGQTQLMMQSGMFVGAKSFSANVAKAIFTHFIKEEDKKLESGKLDEELLRLSEISNHIKADSMILFNESLSSTNEREGSEIARQIIKAFCEKNIKIFFVTHFFDLAYSFYRNNSYKICFLSPERTEGGERTFRILKSDPLDTSYGLDLYEKIFERGDKA